MAHPLFMRFGDGPLARAGLATATILFVLGLVTGAAPLRCMATSDDSCAPPPVAAPARPLAPEQSVEPPAAQSPVTKVAAIAPQGPTLTRNDVVAGSFAALDVALSSPTSNEPTTRIVRTTIIRVPPATPEPATEVATASSSQPDIRPAVDVTPLAPSSAEPVEAPVTEIAAIEPPAADPPAAEPVAKKSSGGAVVRGSGANVRSSANKGSTVLFALRGGARVTVLDNDHGWLKVADESGRQGWIYKDYVSR